MNPTREKQEFWFRRLAEWSRSANFYDRLRMSQLIGAGLLKGDLREWDFGEWMKLDPNGRAIYRELFNIMHANKVLQEKYPLLWEKEWAEKVLWLRKGVR